MFLGVFALAVIVTVALSLTIGRARPGLMATLRWAAFGLCTLWALGAVILMLGYGAGRKPAELALSALVNFGPFVLSLLWALWPRRPTKR
jgi:hypothetical protein